MPEKRVRAAMMTADPVLAQELHTLGSVYRLVASPDALAEEARAIAAKVASKNPAVMRRLKSSVNNSTKSHELMTLYRAEMSYAYELKIMGGASTVRPRSIRIPCTWRAPRFGQRRRRRGGRAIQPRTIGPALDRNWRTPVAPPMLFRDKGRLCKLARFRRR